ncbi:MAG TPA: hypothetical protein VFA18_10155 [Gemmataceae bacterium]|nr:hypothetical protein [Gemmataceae bacterium]
MPPKVQPAESHTGLIVSLVIFVLLAIVLGVTTYTGYNGQAQLDAAKKKAEDDLKNVKADRDKIQLDEALYRLAAGSGDAKDTEAVGALKGPHEPDFKASIARLKQNGLTWQDDKNAFDTTYAAQLKSLKSQVEDLTSQLAKARKDSADRVASLEADLKAARDGQNKLKADLDDVENGYKTLATKREAEFAKFNQQLAQLREQIRQDNKLARDTKEDYEGKLTRLNNLNSDLRRSYDRISEQVKPVSILDYAKPLGRVVAISPNGDNVYIDLGSSDSVHPRLTFSIFGSGEYRSDRSPKATIEVLAVLQSHLSRAHVTWTRDPGRDPLLKGDQLYNPAWSPNMKTHVAIAGLLNLTGQEHPELGDAIRDQDQFLRTAPREHLIVDAYEDVREGTIKGEITFQTTILVRGDATTFDPNSALVTGVPEVDRKNKLNELRSKMLETAKLKGVQIIPARQFLALIGYQLPRAVRELDYGGTTYGGTSNIPTTEGEPKADTGTSDKAKPAPKKKPAKKSSDDDEDNN